MLKYSRRQYQGHVDAVHMDTNIKDAAVSIIRCKTNSQVFIHTDATETQMPESDQVSGRFAMTSAAEGASVN